jgi:guanylate kinase
VLARCPDAVVVLLVAPDRAARAARLRARGDDEEHIERRLELGEAEERAARDLGAIVVVNDDVERAAAEVAAIVGDARERRGEHP